jgi:hypothetical protein
MQDGTSFSVSSQPVIGRRRLNRFMHQMLQWYDRHRINTCPLLLRHQDPQVAEQVATQFLRTVFTGCNGEAELSTVLVPYVRDLIVRDGFPIHVGQRAFVIENLEAASDVFQDLDKGLFRRQTGLDTHRLLEAMVQQRAVLTKCLKRIHPQDQMTFSECVLRAAKLAKQKQEMRQIRLKRRFNCAPIKREGSGN